MKNNANLLTNSRLLPLLVLATVFTVIAPKLHAETPETGVTNVFNITVTGDNNNIVIGDHNVVVNGENSQLVQEEKGVLTQEFEAVNESSVQEPEVAVLYYQDKLGNLYETDLEQENPAEFAFVLDLLKEQGDEQGVEHDLFTLVGEENFRRMSGEAEGPMLDWVAVSKIMKVAEGEVEVDPSAVQAPSLSM